MDSLILETLNVITFEKLSDINIVRYDLTITNTQLDGTTSMSVISLPNIIDETNPEKITYTDNNATGSSEYFVKPIFKYTNSIGDHNILK